MFQFLTTFQFFYFHPTFISQTTQNLTMSTPNPNSSSSPSPSPPFDPKQPSIPISYPIKTLQELESRSYFDSFHYPFNKASVPISSSSSKLPDRRRLLVCHDMAGGYSDDKWIQGGDNVNAYSIWHWHLIDVFVYFSHDLVTLPPVCWINTAHCHGVKVLTCLLASSLVELVLVQLIWLINQIQYVILLN